MADERDPKVSARYREMGAEEPPRALDEAILAASRRSVQRRRWYGPVAVAAVLMLAVAVTLQVERQKPDEAVVASAPAPAPKEAQVQAAPPAADVPKPMSVPEEKRRFNDELAKQQPESRARADSARDSAAAPAPAAPPAAEPARREMEEAQRPQASAAAGARTQGMMKSQVESPEQWLERIAELRKQGKHEEADKALAEFRERYPAYVLSDETKAKVERK